MFVLANVLQPLIDLAHWILRFFHDNAGLGWGSSIIAMTVVVRLAILPLTYKSVKSMQGIQRLKPEFDRIKEKHADDKQKLNEEMMKLYQEHKINPAGSCLPILLQFPVFIALFYLLRSDEFQADIRGEESFLFIPNLAEPTTGMVLIILLALYLGTQLAASLVTAISADKSQRLLILGLPFLFVFFVINFESGLMVYWITTNIWTVGQQLLVKKLVPPPEPLPTGIKSGLGETNVSDQELRRARKRASGEADGAAADGANGGKRQGGARPAGRNVAGNGRPTAPPPSARKKKKRSGRRR